jgi:hypothetical protein
MRIAQVVLTKTKQGNWKLIVQSLRQTETVITVDNTDQLEIELQVLRTDYEWEKLSDD